MPRRHDVRMAMRKSNIGSRLRSASSSVAIGLAENCKRGSLNQKNVTMIMSGCFNENFQPRQNPRKGKQECGKKAAALRNAIHRARGGGPAGWSQKARADSCQSAIVSVIFTECNRMRRGTWPSPRGGGRAGV